MTDVFNVQPFGIGLAAEVNIATFVHKHSFE